MRAGLELDACFCVIRHRNGAVSFKPRDAVSIFISTFPPTFEDTTRNIAAARFAIRLLENPPRAAQEDGQDGQALGIRLQGTLRSSHFSAFGLLGLDWWISTVELHRPRRAAGRPSSLLYCAVLRCAALHYNHNHKSASTAVQPGVLRPEHATATATRL